MSRWRWPVAVLAAAVVLGSGGYAVAQTRESDPSYRTARATLGDVERTLDLSGTVTAAGRRDLSFGAAGSVSRVAVGAGRKVKSGQVLARLDPTSFDAAVTAAVATVAKAEAQLASDEDSQATAVTAASTAASSGSGSTITPKTSGSGAGAGTPQGQTSGATSTDPALAKLLAQLGTDQKSVTEAQSASSAAIAAARTALTDQAQACQADSGSSPTATPSDGASASADPGDSEDPGDSGDPGDSSDDGSGSADCTRALAAVQDAQDTVAQRQDDLQAALTALGGTLGQAVKASGTSSQGQTQGQTPGQTQGQTPSTTQGQSATQSGGQSAGASAGQTSTGQTSTGQTSTSQDATGQGGSAGSVTAARLAQDQADIDTANARLIQARAEREAATLRAPYAGRILRADVTRGDLVSASDPAFVLVGRGTTTVSATVTTAQVPSVKRGQAVTITPAGWTTSLHGVVSAIGLLPDSSSTFPVTITVDSTKAVAEGTTASVSIVTGSARNAVTIPVSALTRRGTGGSVQVLSGSTVTRTQVTIGVLGSRTASITAGLRAGARVVLADLDAAVPSSTTASTTRRFAGGTAGVGFQRPGQ